MVDDRKEKLINTSLHLFFVIVIGVAALWGIERNTTITILSDEFAYWASAAWLNGRDWSNVMHNFSYYGYGYGFLLAIIMRIFHNPTLMYQAALVANAIMLICNYFIAYKCWLKLVSSNKQHGMIGAFTAVIYCSNIFYARLTLTEVFLSFLFWILILLSASINYIRLRGIGFCIVIMLLLATHNRTWGIVVTAVFSALLFLKSKSNKRKIIEIVFVFLLCCLLAYAGKRYYQSVVYADAVADIINVNDAAGQVSKLHFVISWDGMKSFIISFLGKSYYVLISSFLILQEEE